MDRGGDESKRGRIKEGMDLREDGCQLHWNFHPKTLKGSLAETNSPLSKVKLVCATFKIKINEVMAN